MAQATGRATGSLVNTMSTPVCRPQPTLIGRVKIPLSVLLGEAWVEGSAPVVATQLAGASFMAWTNHHVL